MKFKIKLFAILLVFSGCCINLTAQIAYYDALELSKIGKPTNGKIEFTISKIDNLTDAEKSMLKILAMYDKNLNAQSNVQDVIQKYQGNLFISIQIPGMTVFKIDTSQAPLVGELPKSPISSALGIIDTTTFVEGISKFLVERVKEELSMAFFQKFKDEIIKDKYKIYKNLFPETFKMFESIDEEIYKFSSYIQVLREAFEKDLNNLYENIPRLMADDEIKKFFEKQENKCLAAILNSGFYIIDSLKKSKHPGAIFTDFKINELLDGGSQNLGNAIKLLQIISASLRKNSGDRYWIDKDDLKQLFEKDNNEYVVFKIYMGLIGQQTKDIQFKVNPKDNPIYFSEQLANSLTEIEELKNKIDGFMFRADQVEISLKEMKERKQKGEKPDYKDYYKFYSGTLDILDYSLDLFEYALDKKLFTQNKEEEKYKKSVITEVKNYLGVTRAVCDIYLDIYKKNYSSIVFNLIKIFDSVFKSALKTDFNKIRAGLLKYGSFLAAVAQAQNSDEVKEAIKAVALPAGSSSIKRNSSFNISLNAYVGASVFKGDESDGKEILGFNKARVWSPIGIAISFGKINLFCIDEIIKSITLFASVIDIGAVTAFRFKDESKSEEENPKFTFNNIVSPGLHVVFGIKKSPISFGVGFQRLPHLEKITNNENNEIITTINTEKLWKFNFFIAIDIPLLNFTTR